MKRYDVDSKMLSSLSYDSSSGTLEVEFPNGTTYQYSGVPKSVFEGVLNSGSIGSAFHGQIRNKFVGRKVR